MTNFCERCNGSGWADASCVRLCDDCNGNGVAESTEIERLRKENKDLRLAISEAEYRADQGKLWNGMGWTHTGLSAHGQQKVLDILRAAISSPENP